MPAPRLPGGPALFKTAAHAYALHVSAVFFLGGGSLTAVPFTLREAGEPERASHAYERTIYPSLSSRTIRSNAIRGHTFSCR